MSNNKYTLSKSSYVRGLQCEKSLYLHVHHSDLRNPPDEQQQSVFQRGKEVGILAQQLFPNGINCSSGEKFSVKESLRKTKEALEAGASVLYEAAFVFNNVLAIVDILVKEGKKWKIYEVKSSTEVKEVHHNDAALQYYVLRNAGFSISDISIVTLNKQYVRKGDLNLPVLFAVHPVLKEVKNLQSKIPQTLEQFAEVLSKKSPPNIDIGMHCTQPYDCDFSNYCWKHIPENSVFDLANIRLKKAFDLYQSGIIALKEIKDMKPFSQAQQMQILGVQKKQIHIDKPAIAKFLNTLCYPLYFMDFESFMPAVPIYENSRPYQQIVFQYSLHYMEKPSGNLSHYEFLANAGSDPREEFIQQLLNDTKKKGDILVYNNSFEVPRLKELARDFPKYKKEIEERISRVKDLMAPFRQKAFYHPQLMGSYSIKDILPVLAPDLSYDRLPINNGGLAMNAFEQLQTETDKAKINELRFNLLEYCKLDTLAMVKVVEGLKKIIV